MLDAREEPVDRTRILNGVAVPGTGFDQEADAFPEHESTVVAALRRHVRRGDRVVVIGGGWGTSTVVAARMTHFEGHVTTFEPSSTMLEILRRTIRANGVEAVVDLEHAAVGSVSESSERIFGTADGHPLEPESIPDCDVLDIDAEGAEFEILPRLTVQPRLLTVEAHTHIGGSTSEIECELDRLGYEIVEREPIAGSEDIINYVAVSESDS